MIKCLARFGTRNSAEPDGVMFVKEVSFTAASPQSAKRQATLHAKMGSKVLLIGWRAWGKEYNLGSNKPNGYNRCCVRDTLCTADGRQSFIHLFWEE